MISGMFCRLPSVASWRGEAPSTRSDLSADAGITARNNTSRDGSSQCFRGPPEEGSLREIPFQRIFMPTHVVIPGEHQATSQTQLFCLTSRKADFVPSHPFFNLLCTFRGGQVVTQGQHADLLDRSATLWIPTAKPFEIKGIKPGFRAIP